MNTMKDNFYDFPDSPLLEWISLDNVAKKWECSKEIVIEQGIIGNLRISFNFKIAKIAWFDFSKFTDNGEPYDSMQTEYEVVDSILGITSEDLLRLNNGEINIQPHKLLPPSSHKNDNRFARYAVVYKPFPSRAVWDPVPQVESINICGLGLLKWEMIRFEGECGDFLKSNSIHLSETALSIKKLDPRKRKSYLQIIHVLMKDADRRKYMCLVEDQISNLNSNMTKGLYGENESIFNIMKIDYDFTDSVEFLELNYLQVIRLFLDSAEFPEKPYNATTHLRDVAEKCKLELPMKDDTIANIIKAARQLRN